MGTNKFAEMLKYYLMMNNKTQSDLVNDLGFDKSTVSNWCAGLRVPKVDVIIDIANYLHVNVGDLIEDNRNEDTYYLNVGGIVIEINPAKQEQTEAAKRILAYCNKLNDKGIKEAAKRVEELTYIPEYNTDDNSLLNAAHELEGASKTEQQHDNNIMDNDDEWK